MVSRYALVTGATGGLGRELVGQLLDAGYRVRATGRDVGIGAALGKLRHPGERRDPESHRTTLVTLGPGFRRDDDRRDDGGRGPGIEFIPADLVTDPLEPLVADIDVVFHLAALSSPWGPVESFRAINVDATVRLLGAARNAGCGAFVHASTPSIYTRWRDSIGITERSPLPARFINDYAATKYAGECAVLAADAPGFRTVALRPRAIVGPHDSVLLPRLMRGAARGRLAMPGGGRALIELTDVRDVAAAFLAADRRREIAGGSAINLSGGDPRPLRDLLAMILGRSVRLTSVPTRVARVVASAMELAARLRPGRPEPSITRYTVAALGYSQTMCLDRARDLLDWTPRYASEAMIEHALGHCDA